MNQLRVTILASLLGGSLSLFGQAQSADANHQDVPTQQVPGTNNPDVGKQRRSTQSTPQSGGATTESADVPQEQQPGTNNPDVAKQRRDASGSGSTDSTGAQQGGAKKKSKRKSTRTDL